MRAWGGGGRGGWEQAGVVTPSSSLQTEYARLENGRFVYRIHRSPMCEYMINFIHKLKHLPEKYMMNSVLENFTILQVRGTQACGGWSREGARHRGLRAEVARPIVQRKRPSRRGSRVCSAPTAPALCCLTS